MNRYISFPCRITKFVVPILFALLTILTSCQEEEMPQVAISTEDTRSLAIEEVDQEILYEEIEEIAWEATETLVVDPDPDNRMATPTTYLTQCATLSHDTISNEITVDFGDGCTGPNGRVRSGKIIISYSRLLLVPGAERRITLENFMVDSAQVMGTKILTNVSDSLDAPVSLNTELVDGKIIFPDQTIATRSYSRTRTWIRGNNPLADEFQVTGTVEGTNRQGESYAINITSPLTYKRICRRTGVFIAVAGVKHIQPAGHSDVEIDYGNGDCDATVNVTFDGTTQTVDVQAELKRRSRR